MRAFDKKKLFNLLTAFFGLWALQLTIGITVRNPLTVVLFACLYLAFDRLSKFAYDGGKRALYRAVILILPVAFAAVPTLLLYRRASAGFSSALFKLLTIAILAAGYYCLFVQVFRALSVLLFRDRMKREDASDADLQEKSVIPLSSSLEKKVFFSVAAVCFICFLPYFLYEFPGIMTADSLVQYGEIFGSEPLTNHHPVIHTYTIGLLVKLGLAVTGNPVTAVSFYTMAQMIFMCLCYGALVVQVNRILGNFSLKRTVLLTALLALLPINAVFAVTIWKDVPFAGISILLSCQLIEMYRKRDEGLRGRDFAGFVFLGVLFGLYRSNAFYAMVAMTPFFVYVFRRYLRTAITAMFLVIALTAVIKDPVYKSFGIGGPDIVESLSVPLQQVARVLVEDRQVSQEDLELIDAVIDRTYVKELYAPDFADNIKELVRAGHPEVIAQNKGRYIALWGRLLLQNPGQYISAWYDLVGGYIYPDKAYEVATADGIMPNASGLYSEPIIGGRFIKVKEILIKLSDFMPLYGMLFSIGAYTWALVISLCFVIKKKGFNLIHVLMLLIVGTLLLAAPVVDFRYAYAVVLNTPLFIALAYK